MLRGLSGVGPYTDAMRKFLAITLLIAFGFPVLSALVGLQVEGQSTLAACCRKGGAHHCTGGTTITGGGPALSAVPCSRFPSPAKALRVVDTTAPLLRKGLEDVAGFAVAAPLNDCGRVRYRGWAAHAKRGPPSQIV